MAGLQQNYTPTPTSPTPTSPTPTSPMGSLYGRSDGVSNRSHRAMQEAGVGPYGGKTNDSGLGAAGDTPMLQPSGSNGMPNNNNQTMSVSSPEQIQNQERLLNQYGRHGVMAGQQAERAAAEQQYTTTHSPEYMAYMKEVEQARRELAAQPALAPQQSAPSNSQSWMDRAAGYVNNLVQGK